jgi:hypothetical protein
MKNLLDSEFSAGTGSPQISGFSCEKLFAGINRIRDE